MATLKKILILSDGRAGHLNQSIAFAKCMNEEYEVVSIKFRSKWLKWLSIIFDKLHLSTDLLYSQYIIEDAKYDMIVSTGSSTYYLNKFLSQKLHSKSIAMMLPRGYRLNFDLIFAQMHDNPPKARNIKEIPANYANVEPKSIYKSKGPSIGIVIGGNNKYFTFSEEKLKIQLDLIKKHYQGYEIAMTTSPRTSLNINHLIKEYRFDYTVIYAETPVNPIPDFIDQCETVFITADSTSMISEVLAFGKSNVIVLPLEGKKENKFTKFIARLQEQEYLHVFDGTFQKCNKKIDFCRYVKEVQL